MDEKNLVSKLNEIKLLADECLASISSGESMTKNTRIIKNLAVNKVNNTGNYVLLIVNKIKNCQESDKIDSNILGKSAIPGRVLLPFFICYKYFPEQGLTSGDIEKITSELRVRIKTLNVSNSIANTFWKYLDGDSSRVKGKPVIYKLNRRGASYFESLLNQNDES